MCLNKEIKKVCIKRKVGYKVAIEQEGYVDLPCYHLPRKIKKETIIGESVTATPGFIDIGTDTCSIITDTYQAGFHCFVSLKSAMAFAKNLDYEKKLIYKVRMENVHTTGLERDWHKPKYRRCYVASKITFLELIASISS